MPPEINNFISTYLELQRELSGNGGELGEYQLVLCAHQAAGRTLLLLPQQQAHQQGDVQPQHLGPKKNQQTQIPILLVKVFDLDNEVSAFQNKITSETKLSRAVLVKFPF